MAAASATFPRPSTDFPSLPRRYSEHPDVSPSLFWDEGLYGDPALVSSESCESLAHSPVSPASMPYLQSNYALPGVEGPVLGGKADHRYPYAFDGLLGWDDPISTTLKLEPCSPTMAALDMSSPNMSVNPAAISNSIDDGSVTFQDAGIETPLFQTPRGSAHDELDLMPMSWSRPQPIDSLGSQSPYPSRPSIRAVRLRSLTIPQPPYPTSPASTAHSSPEPTDNRRKRKSSADSSESDSPPHRAGGRHPPVKKTAHNMIEKRYRTNLNDKISALRDSVPSLRATVSKNARGEDSLEDLQGLTPAHKLNKATVLSKATEYIAHLEKRTKQLQKENQVLKARIDAFENLIMARSGAMHANAANSTNSITNINTLNNPSSSSSSNHDNNPANTTASRGGQGQLQNQPQTNDGRPTRRILNNGNRNSTANPPRYTTD